MYSDRPMAKQGQLRPSIWLIPHPLNMYETVGHYGQIKSISSYLQICFLGSPREYKYVLKPVSPIT